MFPRLFGGLGGFGGLEVDYHLVCHKGSVILLGFNQAQD